MFPAIPTITPFATGCSNGGPIATSQLLSQRLRFALDALPGEGSSGDLAAGSAVGVLRLGRDPASVPALTQRPPRGAIAVVALLVGVDRGAKVEFGSAGLG